MKSQPFRLELASLSDPGKLRALNEDGVVVDREFGFAALADGMGGQRAGDVASRLALNVLATHLRARAAQADGPSRQSVVESVAAANAAVHAATLKQTVRTGMGATLAMAVFGDENVILAHVGDSRIYRLREGKLALLTRDDTILNDQVEMGLIGADDINDSHNRRMVTQTLGMGAQVAAHVREEALREGDVYLLCSDGLNDLVGDEDIAVIIDALKTNLPLTASHLVQLANDSGGYDNVSVALVRVLDNEADAGSRGWLGRLFGRKVH
jgi:serine/threonine protein phosphatase PrpC